MVLEETRKVIENSIRKLGRWVEDHQYKGYEPFDGLSSPLRRLTLGNPLLSRVLMQLVRQSPLNLRPLLAIGPKESTKGRGYMASGYFSRWQTTGDLGYRDKAVACLAWLMENKSPRFREYSWGNHFDFVGRGGFYGKDDSIIVWTALIGHAFWDGFLLLSDTRYRDVVDSACRWILGIPRKHTSEGTCIGYRYGATENSYIHNSNMLGASLLARAGRYLKKDEYLEVASEAMKYSCSLQRPDGSWHYGEDPMYHWIDSFHTGYNLDSLKCYIENTGDGTCREGLLRGLEFYKRHFFEQDGCPRYYHNRTYPIDSQCAAQAIETLANFSDQDDECRVLAVRVALWTIDNMQDEAGYFYYRKYPLIKVKTPMLHWAQATTYRGLSLLLLRLKNR